MDYCTLADVKGYGGITQATTDAALTALIPAASAFIDRWCNRTFDKKQNVVEVRNGNGNYKMMPMNRPIISVSSVLVDNVAIPPAPSPVSAGFVFDQDLIYLRGVSCSALFTKGVQNVSFTYTSGFDTVPGDIKQACIELVLFKFGKRDRLDKNSDTLQQQTVSYSNEDCPAGAKKTLNFYRMWPVT